MKLQATGQASPGVHDECAEIWARFAVGLSGALALVFLIRAHQFAVRRTDSQTQKLSTIAVPETKVMTVPGKKFTYPGKSTNSR